jgi:hypothetical protein
MVKRCWLLVGTRALKRFCAGCTEIHNFLCQVHVQQGRADFVDVIIVNVSCDLRFGQNQPLKLAGDQYIGIWENYIKLNKFFILKRTEG